MIDRHDDTTCAVCARRAVGYGYAPRRHKVMWVCDDPECLVTVRTTYDMKQDDFTRIESLAAQKGGDEGGAYLDQIDKTDLSLMTPDEWCEFCRRVVAGYRKALATDLADEAPF